MIAHRVWAFIIDGVVKNTVICENYPLANQLAKNTLGTDAFAVEITQIPTGIGDKYENGEFIDIDGNVIEPIPPAEEVVHILEEENKRLKRVQADQDDIIMDILLGGM